MKFSSYEHFDLSIGRVAAIAVGAAALATAMSYATLGNALGPAMTPVLLMVALVTFYGILSSPRRLLDRQRVAEAKEAVLLAAAANACLNVTGSRSRTTIVLRSRQPSISKALLHMGKQTLLGIPVEASVAGASDGTPSFSAASVFRRLAGPAPRAYEPGDEEVRGLDSSSSQSRETKLPIFMTVSFFAPIMLLFYAIFSHVYGVSSLTGLAVLEFILLDIAFYFSSGEGSPR